MTHSQSTWWLQQSLANQFWRVIHSSNNSPGYFVPEQNSQRGNPPQDLGIRSIRMIQGISFPPTHSRLFFFLNSTLLPNVLMHICTNCCISFLTLLDVIWATPMSLQLYPPGVDWFHWGSLDAFLMLFWICRTLRGQHCVIYIMKHFHSGWGG